MVTIELISVAHQPPSQALRVELDETGGTIGRAPTNKIPLDDPDRTVSRVHAQIVQRQGTVIVISRGSNPLLVNREPLEIGEEVPLSDGSVLEMGAYVLRAHLTPSPSNSPTA